MATFSGRIWTLDVVKSRCEVDGDCWIWANACNSRGYPQASIENKPQLVARWVLNHKAKRSGRPPLTSRECAVPRCGNRLCVSPLCLERTARSKLLQEAYASGARNADLRGRQQSAIERGWAKLDREQVRVIKLQHGTKSAAAVAREAGVHEATIRRIWNGERWRDHGPANSVFAWRPAA